MVPPCADLQTYMAHENWTRIHIGTPLPYPRRGSRIQKGGGFVHSEGGGGSYRNFRSGSKLLQGPGQINKQKKIADRHRGGSDHPPPPKKKQKNLYPRLYPPPTHTHRCTYIVKKRQQISNIIVYYETCSVHNRLMHGSSMKVTSLGQTFTVPHDLQRYRSLGLTCIFNVPIYPGT